jgi:hypothetical protein
MKIDVDEAKQTISGMMEARGRARPEAPPRRGKGHGPAGRTRPHGLPPDIAPPFEPRVLARPFAVWDFRKGQNASFLTDWEVKDEGSSAYLSIDRNFDSDFLEHDQVAFYFFWQNDSGADATVNVQSALTIHGFARIRADSGIVHTPLSGVGTNGHARLVVTAELALMEWWNQPPTQAPPQVAGKEIVRDESVTGGWLFNTSKNMPIESETYYLHHDGFAVPAGGVALIEVSLNFYYSGYDGGFGYDYAPEHQNHQTVCPWVQIELT